MKSTHTNFVKTSLDKIYQASISGRLAFFVGAGVSANSGLPTWGKLIERFAQELYADTRTISKKFSAEDYLKIPEYYHNSRGNKEYWDIINSVFELNVRPNVIHKAIFDLNPYCVITTNFDTLLEDAASELQKRYHVVAHNTDLPYSRNDRHIIKMHGDLKRKNIVLRESDFLSYSKNFSLIETFIKAIFSHKLVVFLGYSANDPDFKLLYQSVKDVLGGDFQPAYLINTSTEYDDLEYHYYKQRGIHLLYAKEFYKNISYETVKESTNERFIPVPNDSIEGELLLRILGDIALQPEKNIVEKLYEMLLPLDIFCYLSDSILMKILNDNLHSGFSSNNGVLYIANNEVGKSFQKLNKYSIWKNSELRRKARFILRQIAKAGIRVIVSQNNSIKIYVKKNTLQTTLQKENTPDNIWHLYEEKLLRFQWNDIEYVIFEFERDGISFKQAEDLFTYSYLCTTIGLPDKACNALTSYIHTQDRANATNYLARFNLKVVSFSMQDAQWKSDERNSRRFEKHPEYFDKITNLHSAFDNLSPYEQRSVQHIHRFEYINSLHNEAFTYLEELEKIKTKLDKSITMGGVSSNVHKSIHDFFNYSFYNGVYLNIYSEVQKIYTILTKCILLSHVVYHKLSEQQDEKSRTFRASHYYIKALNVVHIYNIVTHCVPSELRSYLIDLKIIRIVLSEDVQSGIVDSFSELVKASNNEILVNDFLKYITNYLLVLSYCELGIDDVNKVLHEVTNMKRVLQTPFLQDFIDSLNLFITHHSKRMIGADTYTLENILWLFDPLSDLTWTHTQRLTINIRRIIQEHSLVLNDTNTITKQFAHYKEEDGLTNHDKLRLFNYWIYHLYPLLPEEVRATINVEVQRTISNIKHEYLEQHISTDIIHSFIFNAYDLDIIDKSCSIIDELIDYALFLNQSNESDTAYHKERKSENLAYLLYELSLLIMKKKISQKHIQRIRKEFYGIISLLDYILEPNSFDYTRFSVSWLSLLPLQQILSIKADKKNKKIIRTKLIDALQKGSTDNNFLRECLDKHFL